tara:strand:- start:176 stop:991 length:816 start_codon:yes stop_codon:yes gene_type:complete
MRSVLVALHKISFFKRLIPSLLRRLPFVNSLNVKIENFKINLNLRSTIDRYIFLNGFYDKDKISYLENQIDLSEYDYFLDIGSNIGFYSLYLASKYKNLEIFAFEPIEENYSQIEISKKINDFRKLNIQKYALSNKQDEVIMWVTDLNKKGGFSIKDEQDFNNELNVNNYSKDKIYKRIIKSEIFDQNFRFENKKIFIKIDVERHEFQCLNGMVSLLSENNNKVFIQIEIIDRYKELVLGFLEKMQFKVIKTLKADGKNISYGHDYYLSNF